MKNRTEFSDVTPTCNKLTGFIFPT